MTTSASLKVECPCGAVEIELTGEPLAQFYCHCDDCQRVHSAAYAPEVMFNADNVKVTRGETTAWQLKTTPRVTCALCGTRLFADVVAYSIRGVSGYLMPRDGARRFKAEFHINCQFAVLPVRDDLPHYKGAPSRFNGTDDLVEW